MSFEPASASALSGAERSPIGEGRPGPLGVSFDAATRTWHFALYARHALRVTLLLYGAADYATPVLACALDHLVHKSGSVWHCSIAAAAVPNAVAYAYQVDGPRDESAGHRYRPEKILLDPFARVVLFPPGFSRAACIAPGANAGLAPLGQLTAGPTAFDWGDDHRPRRNDALIIYELHVRGYTARANSGVAAGRRGTYAGLIEKIPYLVELGITAVELLPVFQFDPQEGNYWGYMPLSFFAPHQHYAAAATWAEQIDEFRALVRALHQADIEVILDVVYNHSCEADDSGPTYGMRGIDNSAYYLMDERGRYRDDSGTGNVLHAAEPLVRELVLESLRYWAREMHVDGFRFDLASLLTRNSDGSINLDDPPLIVEIERDPLLRELRLIAEPWDLGSYQLGSFPGRNWRQWNDRFRDDIRAAVRGDHGLIGRLMLRLYGSDDVFPDRLEQACRPWQSVNFVTAHDGFCLYDLVSYARKHNEANGHDNRDGHDNNLSWNCGHEGDEGAGPEVLALRQRQARNFICVLLLANGTPMLVAGDEFLNTQGGNNNPYNQDNETTWLDWDRLQTHAGFHDFCRMMIAFRRAHPVLWRSRFWREEVRWFGPAGAVDFNAPAPQLGFHLKGARPSESDICAVINFAASPTAFPLPGGAEWWRVLDTGLAPGDIAAPGSELRQTEPTYPIGERSVAVFVSRPD